MEFSIRFCVFNHSVTLFIEYSRLFIFFTLCTVEVIMIHKIIARVIWRVNINHLDLAHIGVLKQLQHFEVVALYVEVLGLVPIHAFFGTRAQRLVDGGSGFLQCRSFAHPGKVIDFGIVFHGVVSKQQTEFVEVHYAMDFSVLAFCFGETRGGNLIKGVEIELCAIWRFFCKMFHIYFFCIFALLIMNVLWSITELCLILFSSSCLKCLNGTILKQNCWK